MTRDIAKEFLPILRAFVAGETIQEVFSFSDFWHDVDEISFEKPAYCYRIKPKDTPKIPLTQEDFLKIFTIRNGVNTDMYRILRIEFDRIEILNSGSFRTHINYRELADNGWMYYSEYSNTWLPCHK